MFLLEPGRTPYDINWRILGVHVRIHPMFWLIGAIWGFQQLSVGMAPFLLWMASFFLSILIHEMGHIMMGRAFGNDGHIVLYAFGGLAIPHRAIYARWQRVAVSFAGPLAGFILFGIVAAIYIALGGRKLPIVGTYLWTFSPSWAETSHMALDPVLQGAFYDLMWINLAWGLLNLLPIWPLDGGQMSREILDGTMPHGSGVVASLWLSFVLATLVALQCLTTAWNHPLFPHLPALGEYSAVLFGLLAWESFQLLQQARRPRRRQWDDDY